MFSTVVNSTSLGKLQEVHNPSPAIQCSLDSNPYELEVRYFLAWSRLELACSHSLASVGVRAGSLGYCLSILKILLWTPAFDDKSTQFSVLESWILNLDLSVICDTENAFRPFWDSSFSPGKDQD